MNTITLPVTDFIRKFGDYADLLPKLEEIVLMRDGRKWGILKASPEEKNRQLLALRGTWDPKLFGNDKLWNEILNRRRNRKAPIKL